MVKIVGLSFDQSFFPGPSFKLLTLLIPVGLHEAMFIFDLCRLFIDEVGILFLLLKPICNTIVLSRKVTVKVAAFSLTGMSNSRHNIIVLVIDVILVKLSFLIVNALSCFSHKCNVSAELHSQYLIGLLRIRYCLIYLTLRQRHTLAIVMPFIDGQGLLVIVYLTDNHNLVLILLGSRKNIWRAFRP